MEEVSFNDVRAHMIPAAAKAIRIALEQLVDNGEIFHLDSEHYGIP